MLGAYGAAERSLRGAIAAATEIGLHQVTTQAQHNLGLVMTRRGMIDEGRRIERVALDAFEAQGTRRFVAAALHYLALIEIAAGDFEAAIRYARQAIDAAADKTSTLCNYHATLSVAYRRAGELAEGLAEAKRAMDLIELHGTPEEGEAGVRLAYAEALHATGASDEARRAIVVAEQRLREAAERIRDPEWRRTYLEAVEDNARTLALAQAWRA